MYFVDSVIGWLPFMVGMAISEQSRRINRILKNVNDAVMNHSKVIDVGEKMIKEYGHYRYSNLGPVTLNLLVPELFV